MELQAFMLANVGMRQCLLILAFGAVLRSDGLPPIWKYADKLKAAYRRGRACKNVVAPRYEDYWESTVEEVREQLGLAPLTRTKT